MYDLLAIATGDLAAVVSAVAAVGVLLGMLLGWILRYVLRNESRVTAVETRAAALEEAIKELRGQ